MQALRSLDEAGPLRSELDALNLASRRPSPFAALDYLEAVTAHDEFPLGGSEPLLLVARDGERLVGWLPLRRLGRGGRIDSYLSHETDRPCLLARAEDGPRCAEAFLRWLLEHERCSELHLAQQEAGSPLLPAPGTRVPGYRLRLWPSHTNATIPIPGGTLASWFATLPKAPRHNVARLGRRLLAAGQVDLIWSESPQTVPALLEAYQDVERRSWKAGAAAGISRSATRIALYRELCGAGRSARVVVQLLRLDGVPIAGHFGMWFGDVLHVREITFDEALAPMAPGSLMLLLVVRAALERGASAVNLLSRFGYYKKEWGAALQETWTVQYFREGTLPWLKAWLGDLGRAIRRPAAAEPGRANAERQAAVAALGPGGVEGLAPGRRLAAEVEARVERLDPAALRAALPFKPPAEGDSTAAGGRPGELAQVHLGARGPVPRIND